VLNGRIEDKIKMVLCVLIRGEDTMLC